MSNAAPMNVARWALLAYTLAVLGHTLWYAEAADAVLLGLLFLPWLVGPAAIAALLVRRDQPEWVSWSFVAVELAVIGSTFWLWLYLSRDPDAQSGIVVAAFPVAQLGGVAIGFAAIALSSVLLKEER